MAGWQLGSGSVRRLELHVAPAAVASSLPEEPSPSESEEPAGPVDLNTADAEELMTLPGIGETRAKAIVAYGRSTGRSHMWRTSFRCRASAKGSWRA